MMTNTNSEYHIDSGVTDEIVEHAIVMVDGWYPDGPIDWEDVWDRLDGSELSSGARLDMGTNLLSPGIIALKKAVQRLRKEK